MRWFKQHWDTTIAAICLLFFAVVAFTSSLSDSTIIDELSHISAGYSYVTQHDMRLNPEHPPLVKDLTGLMLLPLELNFDTTSEFWSQSVNGQWGQGEFFLYAYNQLPLLTVRLARLPILILAVLLGWLLFIWARTTYNKQTAVIALVLFVTSPTMIAHARYVTTDIAASLGFVLGIAVFLNAVRKPTWRYCVAFGVVLGIVQLLKFSLVLLIPTYAVLYVLWWFSQRLSVREAAQLLGKLIVSGFIALGVIWFVYALNTFQASPDKVLSDARAQINHFEQPWLVEFDYTLLSNPITRPLGTYLQGIMMVGLRSAGGNTGYFMGQVTNTGWWEYFPVLLLVKEQLALHILALFALATTLASTVRYKFSKQFSFTQWLRNTQAWVSHHFTAIACVVVIAVYWFVTIRSPLNIGIRHVLPTFPFIYILVARGLANWLGDQYQRWSWRLATLLLVGLWLVTTVLVSYPYYLSFYNVLAGGTRNGYLIAADSNYDWGQDLLRLAEYTKARPNEQFYIDYFGSSTDAYLPLRYWLGNQYIEWHATSGKPPSGSKFIVSLTFYMNATSTPVAGFPPYVGDEAFEWLDDATVIDRVGTSLLVFRIP